MQHYIRKPLRLTTLTLLLGMHAASAAAQTSYVNPITYGGITSIPDLLLALVDLVFLIGVPIIVMFIIYGGFLFVTAGDNEAQIAKARTTFKWTLLGALVLLGAKVIAAAIQATISAL